MAASRLDQLVKGAPPPDAQLPSTLTRPPPSTSSTSARPATPDPLATLPSSPPQIYLNLLILESSLRAQYVTLRARRRQYTFFLLLLALWIAYFAYALFLRPREDGRGVGGSVYWVVEMTEKVALMGGVVTGILVWGTGQWERGVRWPRRWLAVANRGLRGMNAKIVIIRGPWWKELLSYLAFLFPFSSFSPPASSFHYVEYTRDRRTAGRHLEDAEEKAGVEEDLAPGGNYIKLLLLPKSFSPEFRENWEDYRNDYWDKENERRAQLLRKVTERERQIARQEGGIFWWTGWRGWDSIKSGHHTGRGDLEKSHHGHSASQHPTHVRHQLEKELKPRRTGPSRSDSQHSRTSSRSTTPNATEADEKTISGGRARRGSSSSRPTGDRKKKSKHATGTGRSVSPLTNVDSRCTSPDDPPTPGRRPSTPST